VFDDDLDALLGLGPAAAAAAAAAPTQSQVSIVITALAPHEPTRVGPSIAAC
jgi:hypothetical protein